MQCGLKEEVFLCRFDVTQFLVNWGLRLVTGKPIEEVPDKTFINVVTQMVLMMRDVVSHNTNMVGMS